MAEKVEEFPEGNSTTLQSTMLAPSINGIDNQQKPDLQLDDPNKQFEMIDESIIENNVDHNQVSMMTQCNNIGEECKQVIEHIGEGTILEAKLYEKDERIQIQCFLFDLNENSTLKYRVELDNRNIPQALETVFDDVEEIFSQVIREKQYELDKGGITFKYQIKKKKEVITRKYRLKMNQIALKKEDQLTHIIIYLKAKAEVSELQKAPSLQTIAQLEEQCLSLKKQLKDEKRKKEEEMQKVVTDQKQQIKRYEIKLQGEVQRLKKSLNEEKKENEERAINTANDHNAKIYQYQKKIKEIQNDHKAMIYQYQKKIREIKQSTQLSFLKELNDLRARGSQLSSIMLKHEINSLNLSQSKAKQFTLPLIDFKKNTKTHIILKLMEGFKSGYNKDDVKVYGFKSDSYFQPSYSLNYEKQGSICVIEVDRFLNKVLLFVDGKCKESQKLDQHVIDREFEILIRLQFKYQVKLQIAIKRSDFLVTGK